MGCKWGTEGDGDCKGVWRCALVRLEAHTCQRGRSVCRKDITKITILRRTRLHSAAAVSKRLTRPRGWDGDRENEKEVGQHRWA